MKTLKKVNYKKIANILKISKSILPDYDQIMVKGNEVRITDLQTLFIHNTSNFGLTDARNVNKDIINVMELNDKNTTLLYDPDSWDVDKTFTDEFEGENNYVIFAEKDTRHLYNAVPFVCKDELRPVMTGVCCNGGICAIDAHKLYFYNNLSSPVESIFPVNFIKIMELLKITNCNIEVNNKFAYLKTDEFKLYCKLIDGKFPNYKVVIPENNPFNIEVDNKLLSQALKQLLPFVNKATNMIKLSTDNSNLILHAENVDYGIEQTIEIPDCVNNLETDFAIGLNLKLLQICIKPLGSNLSVDLSAPNRAIVINNNVVLMPLMLNN